MIVAKDMKDTERQTALERMDKALKAALKMPPRKHKDEPKRRKHDSPDETDK